MKYFITTFVLFISQFFLDSCTNVNQVSLSKKEETKEAKQIDLKDYAKRCLCTQIWLPVCGEDKKTYANACSAECAGIKYKSGSCEKTI